MHPILFTIPKIGPIGPIPVHTFGVMIVLAFIAGYWLVLKRAERYGVARDHIGDLCFYTLIAGVLGARIAFILQELPHYTQHLNELFTLRFQGLTSFGGPIAGFFVVLYYSRKHKIPISTYLDLLAPGFLIGHIVGRFGCLFNGCCYGGVCPVGFPLGVHTDDDPLNLHYPAQIYDAAMNAVALGIILWIEKKRPVPLAIFSWFLILHGLTRFIYEFWRAGTKEQVERGLASSTYMGSLPITQAQALALVFIIGGVILMYFARRKPVVSDPA